MVRKEEEPITKNQTCGSEPIIMWDEPLMEITIGAGYFSIFPILSLNKQRTLSRKNDPLKSPYLRCCRYAGGQTLLPHVPDLRMAARHGRGAGPAG